MKHDISHLTTVFDLLYDGVVVVDKHGNIVFANSACQRIFGYDRNELHGKPLDTLVPSQYRAAHKKYVSDYQKAPLSRLMSERSLLFGVNRQGEEVPVTISIASFVEGEQFYVAVIRDGAILNRQFEEEKLRAETDALTRLGNRRYLSKMFCELSRLDNNHFALLFLDLNKFKPINDEYGHEVGDRVLQIVAKRLRAVLRDNDVVVRVGGDEFAVLVCGVRSRQAATPIIRKLIHSLSRPIHTHNLTLSLGVSIGCAFYPEDGRTEKELLKRSDDAMYLAKSLGTGFSFSSEPPAGAQERSAPT